METERRRRNIIIAVALIIFLAIIIWALMMAGSAGFLPWQAEPTRIPITPFADLPGVGTPAP